MGGKPLEDYPTAFFRWRGEVLEQIWMTFDPLTGKPAGPEWREVPSTSMTFEHMNMEEKQENESHD